MAGNDDGRPVAPPPAEDPVLALLSRQDKVLKQLLQTVSGLSQAVASLERLVPEELGRGHANLAMLARHVAGSDVKLEATLETSRRQMQARLDELTERIVSEAHDRAVEQLLLGVVGPLLDDVDAVRRRPEADAAELGDALGLVRSKLAGAFAGSGASEIAVEPGTTPFDESVHEAVQRAAEDDPRTRDVPAGRVVRVLRAGFRREGRVLRRAGVVVK